MYCWIMSMLRNENQDVSCSFTSKLALIWYFLVHVAIMTPFNIVAFLLRSLPSWKIKLLGKCNIKLEDGVHRF